MFHRMPAAVASATLSGAVGRPVSVEVHVSNGLPGFTIVGLPDAAVREARDRGACHSVQWPALADAKNHREPLRLQVLNLSTGTRRQSGLAGLSHLPDWRTGRLAIHTALS